MSITYSFEITSINRLVLYIDEDGNRFDNLITKIHFYYQGTDDNGVSAKFNSSISLAKPKINTYATFTELKEEELLAWLETSITDAELSLMQSVIEKNIIEKTTTSELPWET